MTSPSFCSSSPGVCLELLRPYTSPCPPINAPTVPDDLTPRMQLGAGGILAERAGNSDGGATRRGLHRPQRGGAQPLPARQARRSSFRVRLRSSHTSRARIWTRPYAYICAHGSTSHARTTADSVLPARHACTLLPPPRPRSVKDDRPGVPRSDAGLRTILRADQQLHELCPALMRYFVGPHPPPSAPHLHRHTCMFPDLPSPCNASAVRRTSSRGVAVQETEPYSRVTRRYYACRLIQDLWPVPHHRLALTRDSRSVAHRLLA